jgi:hypothetical protein
VRVNARLDEAHSEKLEELCRRTGRTRTDVLKAAIDRYYAEVSGQPANAADVLARSGFVGCAAADSELASDYKGLLAKTLKRKTGGHR